jgi:hypothetical protein
MLVQIRLLLSRVRCAARLNRMREILPKSLSLLEGERIKVKG